MKTLIIRTLSGAVYVALIVWAILWNDFAFAAVFAVLAALTTYEFHKLTNKQENVNALAWLGAICSILLFTSIAEPEMFRKSSISNFPFWFEIGINAYMVLIFFAFIIEIFRKKQNIMNNIAYLILGQIYIAVPFVCFIIIKSYIGAIYLLSIFIIIWINDSFAYLFGSAFGKHKMCERISPKKSWEGFVGGLFGALIAAYLLFRFAHTEYYNALTLWQWLIFALIIVVFGTLGDFFESLIKRTIGVKDSGNIMPGHGGFLDRFDSVIFAALPALIFLMFCF